MEDTMAFYQPELVKHLEKFFTHGVMTWQGVVVRVLDSQSRGP